MPFNVAWGISSRKDAHDALQEALASCKQKISLQEVNFTIIFTTPSLASITLLRNLKQTLRPGTPIIGSSGMAIITPEGILKEGLVILMVSCPKVKLSCGAIDHIRKKGTFASGQELGANLIAPVRGYRRELCLLFTDGLLEDTSSFLKGLQSIMGKSFPFIGGGAADQLTFTQTYQYYDEDILTNGSVAMVFAGKLNYGFGIRHGWKPLGKIRTITESNANIIKKIDGKKASHLYEDYFAKTLAELRKEIFYMNILYPIGIYLAGENEYLLRNVISLNEDGSIIAQGDVPQDSQIRLMIGTKESCLEAAHQAAVQANASANSKKFDLCLLISSASRARLLARKTEEEIDIVKKVIGEETPIFGFYSYGEEAPLKSMHYFGQSYYHNQAIAILGIGE